MASRSQYKELQKKQILHKIPKSIDELARWWYLTGDRDVGNTHGIEFATMVCGFATNESRVMDAVNLIFDTIVVNKDYSCLGSKVCKLIVQGGSHHHRAQHEINALHSVFMHQLLSRFQFEVNRMKETRSKSIELWLGIFAFLCEIYRTIQVGGEPIQVVGKAILQTVEIMLGFVDSVDEEFNCICTKMKVCGQLLEKQAPIQVEKIFDSLRQHVISDKSSCKRRCYIMELIELKQLGWTDPTGSINNFYDYTIKESS